MYVSLLNTTILCTISSQYNTKDLLDIMLFTQSATSCVCQLLFY